MPIFKVPLPASQWGLICSPVNLHVDGSPVTDSCTVQYQREYESEAANSSATQT